jgi:hypothetical protein
MRTLTGIVAVLLIQLLTACDKPSPVAPGRPAPSPPAPTNPPALNGEKWDLTTTMTSIDGRTKCGAVVGAPFTDHSLLTIERSGDSMRLIVSDLRNPGDAYEYLATVTGTDFSGHGTATPSGYFRCGQSDRDTVVGVEDRLAGRFSADGTTLTADDELVDQLESGNVVTYHFAWTATKQ